MQIDDSYGPPTTSCSDVEILENWGVFLPVTGYRKTQHFLDRAEGSGLIELWEHRGPPDYCSKDSRELDRLRIYISKSYRGVRFSICITVHDHAQLIHAKLTHCIY